VWDNPHNLNTSTHIAGSHEYFDNLCRFALLNWAAIEAPLMLPPDDPYGEEIIFIANDWYCTFITLFRFF